MLDYVMAGAMAGQSLLGAWGQANNAKLEADQLEWKAGQVQRYARQQAELVAKQGRYAKGAAAVSTQQAGVTDSGTAALLMDELSKNIQSDIFQTVLSGDLQAITMRASAEINRINSQAAQQSALVGALAAGAQGYMIGSQYEKSHANLTAAKKDSANKKSILGGG